MPTPHADPYFMHLPEAQYALGRSYYHLLRATKLEHDPLPIAYKGGTPGQRTRIDARALVEWANREAIAKVVIDPQSSPVLNLEAERARLAKAQADAHELKNATTRGELVPVENVEQVIAGAGQDVRALLVALPLDIKRREPALTSGAIAAINECVSRCLNAIAEVSIDDEDEPDGGERAAA